MRHVSYGVAAVARFGVGFALGLAWVPTFAGVIDPSLERAMARRGTHADTAVIVRFDDPVNASGYSAADRTKRDNRLLLALKERAARNRAAVEPILVAQEATRIKDLWIINAVAATVPAIAVKLLAQTPGIARIDLDSFVQGGRSQRTPLSPNGPGDVAAKPPTLAAGEAAVPPVTALSKVEWNIEAIHAPKLWGMGYTGKGVVVASMDTGVDLAQPLLARNWRGGANSWFDPHGEQALPYDVLGHGTQALGVIAGWPEVGVAPDAQWIAVRLYNNEGRASMSDIHVAFQWLLDPDGDPATIDAPDVVNASWALTGRATGSCILEFNDDIKALKSAGIAVVFAAGNDGPSPRTSNSPGNNPGVMSVGAVDRDRGISRQTSRGPSACDDAPFPKLMAPGVNVRTADISYGGHPSFATVSGSSLAAPHVSGVLALLASAFPTASVSELERALLSGTKDVLATGGGKPSDYVRVDAWEAYKLLRQNRESVTSDLTSASTPR